MRPARSNEPPFAFSDGDREKLAELEHTRWLQTMIAFGWSYELELDDRRKIHPAMLSWRTPLPRHADLSLSPEENAALGPTELPESEKTKVRNLIDGIPRILAKAGYSITKVRANDPGAPHARQFPA